MAFNRYYLYSDLMKQLSASQPSEMAVSLVTSNNNPAVSSPSPLKRPAEISPLKHIMASGALDLHVQNPVKLLSDSINNTLNGGGGGTVLANGGLEPLAKKLRLEGQIHNNSHHTTATESLNNNAESTLDNSNISSSASRLTQKHATTNLLPGNLLRSPGSGVDGGGKPYNSCGWGLGNASPIRSQEVSESISPQPPTLNPITPPDEVNRSPRHQQHQHLLLPNLEPPAPLVIKPAMVANSPSRSSTDGELSLENTDPNADPMEGHEVCPECQKVFKRKIYLQRHMEREHWSTAKVFKCDDCNYETKHQSNLSVHRRTHTGERPYHCGACGQRYTQGHLLKSHIRSRHGGNMEFYNLDKKSDSTRGRKSLDIKHDINIVHRQDKISTLLQAAAAANGTQGMQPPKSPFGNLLPAGMPYMNALSPFYNMQNNRGLMASPLALGNPLSVAGSNFFTLRGMPGLPSSMLPTSKPVNTTFPPSPDNSSATTANNKMNSPHKPPTTNEKLVEDLAKEQRAEGLLMMKHEKSRHEQSPTKVNVSASPESGQRVPGKMSMPIFMRPTRSPLQQQQLPVGEYPAGAPEDLSVKPTTDPSAAILHHYHHSNETSRQGSHHDLVISSASSVEQQQQQEEEVDGEEAEHPTDLSRQSEVMTPPTIINHHHHNEEDQHHNQHQQQHLSFRRTSSISDQDEEAMMYPNDNESDLESSSLSDGHEEGGLKEAVSESRDTFSPTKLMSECCQDNNSCQHADQLTKLRKNVMRMLRCFAPEFSENNIDYSTKEVDQLLYDVMFSNVEELSRKK